ncbi:MAG: thioredoxin [Candidatus Bathyarchaeota archaeon]|nr:thioredoxin [Candidatus Bathyarchaeota archaeon]
MTEDKELERIKRRMMERLMIGGERGPWVDGEVVELTASNFDEALARASRPVLVDFWADWCAPCRVMKPVVEAMAREYAGRVSFAKVDVDRNQGLARRHGVMSIPNFVLFKQGRPADKVVGAVGRPGLEAMLRRHLT